jgi:ankyrin repeat protein
VYCQLVYICGLIPAHIRHALAELPETLDETYERTLRQISKADWEFAHRLFQFVAVASRPLRVEELADLLAFDFKAGPIPTFHEDWRVEDPVDVVLSTCSSLLATVDDRYYSHDDRKHVVGKFIQFSHFSVKEYLTSTRLAEATDIIPRRYHISVTVAHTLAAQACLGILLHLDEYVITWELPFAPFARYAAEHWADHARLEEVWRNVEDEVKQLIDPSKQHLLVCLWIHNPDASSRDPDLQSGNDFPLPLRGSTLHYAILWGLQSIVEPLIIEHPQDVHSQDYYGDETPLHLASKKGHVEVARFLLEHDADVTAQNMFWQTPLHLASDEGHAGVVGLLIERGADLTAQDEWGSTPLHLAAQYGYVEVAGLLVERGADVTAQDSYGQTPLHCASDEGQVEIAVLLIECGADVTAQDGGGHTPLDLASCRGQLEVAGVLFDRGANVTAQERRQTPLHLASHYGHVEFASMLIDRGADVTAQDEFGKTPLHVASCSWLFGRPHTMLTMLPELRCSGCAEVARILLKHGADVTARDDRGRTPFDVASSFDGYAQVAQVLLQHTADSDHTVSPNESLPTPSQRVRLPSSEAGHYSHSEDVPDTEFIGNNPTGFSDEEGEVEVDEEPELKRRKVEGGYR